LQLNIRQKIRKDLTFGMETKVRVKLIQHNAMTACGKLEVGLNVFLFLVSFRPVTLHPRNESAVTTAQQMFLML